MREIVFADAQTAADAACSQVLAALSASLEQSPRASLIVSGGKTPQMLFERLSRADLDWGRVSVALADERWVSPMDPASNERFVRQYLLTHRAAAASFVAMKNTHSSPARGAAEAWSSYQALPRPFAMVLLGMGNDGHTASLFPNNSDLPQALDADAPPDTVAMRAPASPRERVSLNLSALLETRQIIIQGTGDSKRATLERALAPGPATDMPVRAVLRQTRVPVSWYWSP